MSSIEPSTIATPSVERAVPPLAAWARWRRFWIVLIVVMAAIQIQSWWEPGKDAGAHISIARHFAHGQVALFGEIHLHYAPGYPLLVAPLFWISDRPFLAISIVHVALMLIFAGGLARWLRPLVGEANWMVAALVMANESTWYYQRQTASEVLFLPLLVWGAVALRELAESKTLRAGIGWGLLAFILIALGTLTRHVAVFLLVGYGIVILWRARNERSWPIFWRGAIKWCAVAAPVAVVVLLLIIDDQARARRGASKGYGEYMVTDDPWAFRVAEGVRLRVAEFGRMTVPGMRKAYAHAGQWLHFNSLLYLAVMGTVLIGWWRVVRAKPDALLWTLPIYAAFHVFWPFDQATRYMLPMLPVMVVGVWGLIEKWERRYVVIAALLAAHLLVSLGEWGASLRMIEFNRKWWPTADALGEPILAGGEKGCGYGGGAVGTIAAAPGVNNDVMKMLQQVINRRVTALEGGQKPEAKVTWLISPADQPAPAGFTVVKNAGGLALLERPVSVRPGDLR